jgi:hypothetical protein
VHRLAIARLLTCAGLFAAGSLHAQSSEPGPTFPRPPFRAAPGIGSDARDGELSKRLAELRTLRAHILNQAIIWPAELRPKLACDSSGSTRLQSTSVASDSSYRIVPRSVTVDSSGLWATEIGDLFLVIPDARATRPSATYLRIWKRGRGNWTVFASCGGPGS